jgi:hypothetical protein
MKQLSAGLKLPSSRLLNTALLTNLYFPHRCDLFKMSEPNTISDTQRNPLQNRIADESYELAREDVPVFYSATPETDEAKLLGRIKQDNMFTLDRFVFPESVKVMDTWYLVFLSEGPNYQNIYVVQGNPESKNEHPLHLSISQNAQFIYGKRITSSNLPAGIEVRNPLQV